MFVDNCKICWYDTKRQMFDSDAREEADMLLLLLALCRPM